MAGELVKPHVAPNLLALIAEGCGDDAEADKQVCWCWWGEEEGVRSLVYVWLRLTH